MSIASLERTDGMASGDSAVDVYHYAARCGALTVDSLETAAGDLGLPMPEFSRAVEQLVELGLLRPSGVAGDRLEPAGPAAAAAMLIAPIEREMYRRREHADRLRERIEAIARPQPGAILAGAIDSLEGDMEIRGLLKLAADTCRRELVVLRPGHSDDETLDGLFETAASVLGRGVAVRVLCPHSSRAGFGARARANRLTEAGADFRTISHVPQASAVFDGSVAVVIHPAGPGTQTTARRVCDQGVVQFLVGLFDQLWDTAAPYAVTEAGYAPEVAGDLQQAVARLMAQGLTDEVVARKLGMSLRTCRRHIAALLRSLDSVSRFQAGVRAAQGLAMTGALGAGAEGTLAAVAAGR